MYFFYYFITPTCHNSVVTATSAMGMWSKFQQKWALFMHKSDLSGLQLDWSWLSYLEYLGLSVAGGNLA